MAVAACGGGLGAALVANGGNRLAAALFGATGGICSLIAAMAWAAGSKFTSKAELVIAAALGGAPAFFAHRRFARWRTTRGGVAADGEAAVRWTESYRRRLLVVTLCAFAAESLIAAMDLSGLERHTPVIGVWGPILSFYDRFGYWPALLLCPSLGLIVLTLFARVRR